MGHPMKAYAFRPPGSCCIWSSTPSVCSATCPPSAWCALQLPTVSLCFFSTTETLGKLTAENITFTSVANRGDSNSCPAWEVPNRGLTNGGVRATCEYIIALWKATSLAKAPKATPCYKMTPSAALRTTTCNTMQISKLDRGLYQKSTQGYKKTGFVTPPFVTPPFGTG